LIRQGCEASPADILCRFLARRGMDLTLIIINLFKAIGLSSQMDSRYFGKMPVKL
jgi:hypothetical protein